MIHTKIDDYHKIKVKAITSFKLEFNIYIHIYFFLYSFYSHLCHTRTKVKREREKKYLKLFSDKVETEKCLKRELNFRHCVLAVSDTYIGGN